MISDGNNDHFLSPSHLLQHALVRALSPGPLNHVHVQAQALHHVDPQVRELAIPVRGIPNGTSTQFDCTLRCKCHGHTNRVSRSRAWVQVSVDSGDHRIARTKLADRACTISTTASYKPETVCLKHINAHLFACLRTRRGPITPLT